MAAAVRSGDAPSARCLEVKISTCSCTSEVEDKDDDDDDDDDEDDVSPLRLHGPGRRAFLVSYRAVPATL